MTDRVSASCSYRCIQLLVALAVFSSTRSVSGQFIYAAPFGEGGTWNVYEVFGLGVELNNPRWRVAAQQPKTWREAEQFARVRTEAISGQGLNGHLATIAGPNALAENSFLSSLAPVHEAGA